MPTWLWWVVGAVATYYFNVQQQHQAALQSLDVGLLMVRSATAASAASAQQGTPITSAAGQLSCDQNVPQNLIAEAQALSLQTLAPNWLALATALESAGYPVLSNSVASLGMTLLESGQLNLS